MKKALIIIGVVVAVMAAGMLLFRKFFARSISFDFNVPGNAGGILSLLQSRYQALGADQRGGIYFDVPLTTIIKNDGAAKVILQNIAGSISYDGETIMQTRANSPALANIEIARGEQQSVTDNVQLLVNEGTIKFFKELIDGKKPKVLYNFSTVIFGKPKSFSNQTNVNNQ
jgi:hypothetical protein